jgi:type II secretory pathway predicted ATPase ExeA
MSRSRWRGTRTSLFPSPKHRSAPTHLMHGLRGGGFVLLTGEIGASTTAVWRTLLEQQTSNFDVAYAVKPQLGVAAPDPFLETPMTWPAR